MEQRLVETNIIGPTFITSTVVLNVAGVTVLIKRARSILELDASSPVSMLAPAVGGAGGARVGATVGWANGFGQVSGTIVINWAFQASAVVIERVMSRLTITICLTFRARG